LVRRPAQMAARILSEEGRRAVSEEM